MTPDVERLPKPIDVLRKAELADASPGSGVQVAAHILLGEGLFRGGVQRIRPQMGVVVGQHRLATRRWATTARARGAARRREDGIESSPSGSRPGVPR